MSIRIAWLTLQMVIGINIFYGRRERNGIGRVGQGINRRGKSYVCSEQIGLYVAIE